MTAGVRDPAHNLASRRLKVLVAEDNVINQRVAIGLLTQLGHTGVVVSDGSKALTALGQLNFDVVLMDVMMPTMDGLEALSELRLRQAASGRHIPVFMVTAHDAPGDAERFRQAGADGHLPKPLRLDQLQAVLASIVPG